MKRAELSPVVMESIARLTAEVEGAYPDAVTIVVIHRADGAPIDFAATVPPFEMLDVLASLAESFLFPSAEDERKH